MKKRAKFLIHQSSKNRLWYFSLVAPNGKKICQSEGYQTRAKALKGIESIQLNSADADLIVTDDKGKPKYKIEKLFGRRATYEVPIETKS